MGTNILFLVNLHRVPKNHTRHYRL